MCEKDIGGEIKVKNYAITVSIPQIDVSICNTEGVVENVEKIFISLRDYAAQTYAQKVGYDRIRALLKYAATLGAIRCELRNWNYKLDVILYFNDVHSMIDFKNGVMEAVANSAIK